jgi:hypothetical protein
VTSDLDAAPLADLSALPPIQMQRGGDPSVVFRELIGLIAEGIANHPRSQQKRLGPSEVGEPCARKLAYKVTETPEARQMPPAWRPTVGTAVHDWLEEKIAEANMRYRQDNGASRFLLEQRIDAGPCAGGRLTGSCDLYDRVTATVWDWKIIGPSSYKRTRADINTGRGSKRVYQVQNHIYGVGWTNRGLPVDYVGNIFLPSAGELTEALHWYEPFNPQIAHDAMRRVDRIHALTTTLGLPGALAMTNGALAAVGAGQFADPSGDPSAPAIATDTDSCRFCPWLREATHTDLASGCPGAGATARPSLAETLIA